jgi:molecular chaperone GrpE
MKGFSKRKKMTEDKDTVQEHRENENITVSGEPFSPEISPELGESETPEGSSDTDKLRVEVAELQDKFRRLYAEFDNYRKRTQKERIELFKTAGSETMIALLPILDDFERAIRSMEGQGESSTGVILIFNKLKGILEQKGLKRMKSVGEKFDVDLHEAITNIPATEESQIGKVIDEAECGYFLNDKVIRHAKVIVAG